VAGQLLYLDSSAIVKLVVHEPESAAVLALLRSWPEAVSSIVARVEVERVGRRLGGGAGRRARTVLTRLAVVELDDQVIQIAAQLRPPELRTLDAIHLGTALSLGGDLGGMCAYDSRLSQAAGAAGVKILAPTA
jgi:predicted nucleic acid-binding protein